MLTSSSLLVAISRFVANLQIGNAPTLPGDNNAPTGITRADLMNSREFWLSVLLLIFGLMVIAAQLYYLKNQKEEGAGSVSQESVVRLTIVTMIIIGSLILISSGYSSQQIAPAMGLFGTVAGYLIGRQDR